MVFSRFFLLTKWQIILLFVFLIVSSFPANQIYGECTKCHGFPVPMWSDHYTPSVPFFTLTVVAFVINLLFWNVIAGLIIFLRIRMHR